MGLQSRQTKEPMAHIARALDENGWPVHRDGLYLLATECHRGSRHYSFYFGFLDSVASVQVTSVFEKLRVPSCLIDPVSELSGRLNNYLWLGSLSLEKETGILSYRHTVVDSRHSFGSAKKLEAYMEHILNECERIVPAFNLLLKTECSVDLAFESMMLETYGNC